MSPRLLVALVALPAAIPSLALDQDRSPYAVAPELFDSQQPDLGLTRAPGAQTFTVFRAGESSDHYANGAVVIAFRGRLYAQWQSSPRDEDSPDTWVASAVSRDDGETWTPPRVLAPAGAAPTLHSSGGWWTDGTTLIAYVNVWPAGYAPGTGGHAVYLKSTDGETWSAPQRLLDRGGCPVDGIIEQDPHRYGGRLFTAFHVSPGLVAQPFYTDDPLGLAGWTRGEMPHLPREGANGRELEPSLFARADGTLVMVFRDQASSFRVLAAESADRGEHWTQPVVTAMPDARSKQSAGNLPDGTAFLVNCPSGTRERTPLVLTLSRDGRRFDRAFLLRGAADLPPLRFPGKFKRPGYHYPKSIVWSGRLWVAYATNKEDVQVTSIPLARLAD